VNHDICWSLGGCIRNEACWFHTSNGVVCVSAICKGEEMLCSVSFEVCRHPNAWSPNVSNVAPQTYLIGDLMIQSLSLHWRTSMNRSLVILLDVSFLGRLWSVTLVSGLRMLGRNALIAGGKEGICLWKFSVIVEW
jgi:hypothetical protein